MAVLLKLIPETVSPIIHIHLLIVTMAERIVYSEDMQNHTLAR